MRNFQIWLPGLLGHYLKGLLKKTTAFSAPRHIVVCFVDHFEPDFGNASSDLQDKRVDYWINNYPLLASKHKDSDGFHPRHTFFYPIEAYQRKQIEKLAGLCRQGFGEVEIHLHHGNDTEDSLRLKLRDGVAKLRHSGLLPTDKKTGKAHFAFIHGNWALNNSRRDDKWCGVNDECRILAEEGCYADFTLPSAPDISQTGKVNSIYYGTSSSEKPKGHNTGINVKVGCGKSGQLMMIQGPLGLNFKRRKWHILPKIETGDITKVNPPYADRIMLWIKQNIHVEGRPEWIFIKIHTHGAIERNAETILGDYGDSMFSFFEKKYNDGKNFALHYVSAREMYNIIKAAEEGRTGNPGNYRDYILRWK